MGVFCVNYTVKGADSKSMVGALAGRKAFVCPERSGCVVVFDEESDICRERFKPLVALVHLPCCCRFNDPSCDTRTALLLRVGVVGVLPHSGNHRVQAHIDRASRDRYSRHGLALTRDCPPKDVRGTHSGSTHVHTVLRDT